MTRFKTHNSDGTPKTCKFCHCEVWWDKIESRWYDVGGETLHVQSCGLSREHYHNVALDKAEQHRKAKAR
jgi:hypothetical protein